MSENKIVKRTEVKKGLITRLKEALWGTPTEPIPHTVTTGRAVLGQVEQSIGIYVTPSFREMVTTFWEDPVLREGIIMFAHQVVSTGFYLTANPSYDLKINGKTALDVIKEWCDENNLDVKMLEIVTELQAFGNSFFRIDEKYGLQKIPIEAVWRAVPVDSVTPLQIKYNLQLTPLYGSTIIPWGEFIHFRINITGYKAPFGMGQIYSLLCKPTDSEGNIAPSIYDIRLQMRRSLHEGFKKFSFGNELWTFEGMSNEDFDNQKIAETIANMSSTGNRIATNTKARVQIAVPERTQTYDKFIEAMENEFYIALADPSLKLGLEKGFTKSTAIVATELYKNKIANMRKCVKQQLEDLFKQILNKLGYDGKKAQVQLFFGPEEQPKYDCKDIFNAVQMKIIGVDEARELLRKYLKWDLKSTEVPENTVDTKMNIMGTKDAGMVGKPYSPVLSMKREGLVEPKIVITELKDGLAGYNEDFTTIYIDKLVPEWMHEPLIEHEKLEYYLISNGLSWDYAHRKATQYEKVIVEDKGINWNDYNKTYMAILRKIKKRGSNNPKDIVVYGSGIGEVTDRTIDEPKPPPPQQVKYDINVNIKAPEEPIKVQNESQLTVNIPPVKSEAQVTVKSEPFKTEPIKQDINIKVESKPVDVNVKTEGVLKTEPLTVKQEPVEVKVKVEQDKKEDEEKKKLEMEKLKILKKIKEEIDNE